MSASNGGIGDFAPVEQLYLAAARFRDVDVTRVCAKARNTGEIDYLARAVEGANQPKNRRAAKHILYSILRAFR